MRPELIFDLGANHGEDTAFYLAKGFRVVAVEANPLLAEELRSRFRVEIRSGRCVIEEAAVADKAGELTFWINLDCDHWSSIHENYGTRDGTSHRQVVVPAIDLRTLIERYGCPYYLKVDIEGADVAVLRALAGMPCRPCFVSVEEFGRETLQLLSKLGYDRFSIRPQEDKSWCVQNGAEGPILDWSFSHRDSGLFGREVRQWEPYPLARLRYGYGVRGPLGDWRARGAEFFDVHATRATHLQAAQSYEIEKNNSSPSAQVIGEVGPRADRLESFAR